MGVFKEICETREVSGRLAYLSVKQRLEEAISRGWVERVPVMNPSRFSPDQEWFRDKETGEIYRLAPLDERGGWWDKVDDRGDAKVSATIAKSPDRTAGERCSQRGISNPQRLSSTHKCQAQKDIRADSQ